MEEFDRVTTPFLRPNGTVAVPTRGAQSIRLFSPDGNFVESHGGPGDGPGEFISLGGAWARGDTIEAYDGRLRRITRFIPGGELKVVVLSGARSSVLVLALPRRRGRLRMGATVRASRARSRSGRASLGAGRRMVGDFAGRFGGRADRSPRGAGARPSHVELRGGAPPRRPGHRVSAGAFADPTLVSVRLVHTHCSCSHQRGSSNDFRQGEPLKLAS